MDWDAFPPSQALPAHNTFKIGEQADLGMVPGSLGACSPLCEDLYPASTSDPARHENDRLRPSVMMNGTAYPLYGMHMAVAP
eukprot:CAMPEP_0174946118 /NCGR_PEP_ID=MMETSP1355-20121228/83314_1 /TAXON_ID=464990 /ORGANISM="Hemiselmis tepida, Strain CCMP443" /LENGTH=81 /DNA_ID=CAMNT_0016193527 /DNA_START=179 /DNA_END=421 /DNA_ORIENTATION=-